MIRDALKDALLDLRSQLRGRKASAYVLKIEGDSDDKATRKDEDEDDKPKREAKRPGASKASEAVSDGMEALRSEMKEFMNKKKHGTGRPIVALPNALASKSPKASKASAEPAPKAKGKDK